ncbi:Plant self-incompatibility response [Arabidopsis thaliana x Arabidopsis arenosa]|uniref:Plant self-incompatibility response n=1 Tax=Arabidopsis thaliana x Arabidopsis arenosa TaxID=1240361 RepID=A0A8T2AY50_9BRAS|nr:Plant self-incompatibility response [Arabidopsis thaliana x Arabidopsis arenosa]
MKFAAIFLVTCVLFSLLPSHLSQGEKSSMDPTRRPWCPSKKQVFGGHCGNDGAHLCLNLLASSWDNSVRHSPIFCNCTDYPNYKVLCSCPNIICP